MMAVVILLGLLAAGWGIYSIEKKRAGGPVIYPIWRCNLLLLWLAFAGVTFLLVGSFNLPRYLGLVFHPVAVDAIIDKADANEHCLVHYHYQANAKVHTDSDSFCGLKAGQKHAAFYDASMPDYSTLYPPATALANELLAIALLALIIPSVLVAWLRGTWVVGKKERLAGKTPIAVLISGNGSNLQALIDACAKTDYPARIVLVLSNKTDAHGLTRAKAAGIATGVIDHKAFPDRSAFDAALHQAISASGATFVCLAGFMRLLTAGFVGQWQGRMLNIHPSLLPAFKGAHSHADALAAGVKIHGCSVHYVVPEMDSGPIVMQAAVPVLAGDTVETVAARVLKAEHRIYPLALAEALGKSSKTLFSPDAVLISE